MKDKRVATVGHFWILIETAHPANIGIHFRIVNTNNGCLNKTIWMTEAAAVKYAEQLMKWHLVNKSPNGKRRTAKWNKQVTAKYHKTKKQPKDWNRV